MAVVLVTGSSSGIRLATALHFAQRGHDVHAGVRNLATATERTGAIAAGTLPIRPVVLDVNDEASVARAVGEVRDRARAPAPALLPDADEDAEPRPPSSRPAAVPDQARPYTGMAAPLMILASGPTRNKITRAMSLGFTQRS
jgi:NAD(P)-dependent dehydrogenase (short-subunit alcohol dehydrogenase family)